MWTSLNEYPQVNVKHRNVDEKWNNNQCRNTCSEMLPELRIQIINRQISGSNEKYHVNNMLILLYYYFTFSCFLSACMYVLLTFLKPVVRTMHHSQQVKTP